MAWNEKSYLEKKQCTECGKRKEITYFYKRPRCSTYLPKCKTCVIAVTRVYKQKNPPVKGTPPWYNQQYRKLRYGAGRADKEFTITIEDFTNLKKKACYYCNKDFDQITIDRVDNEKGYTPENCVTACASCNMHKNSVSVDICKKVVEFVESHP